VFGVVVLSFFKKKPSKKCNDGQVKKRDNVGIFFQHPAEIGHCFFEIGRTGIYPFGILDLQQFVEMGLREQEKHKAHTEDQELKGVEYFSFAINVLPGHDTGLHNQPADKWKHTFIGMQEHMHQIMQHMRYGNAMYRFLSAPVAEVFRKSVPTILAEVLLNFTRHDDEVFCGGTR
jgi:hypothetical protein